MLRTGEKACIGEAERGLLAPNKEGEASLPFMVGRHGKRNTLLGQGILLCLSQSHNVASWCEIISVFKLIAKIANF